MLIPGHMNLSTDPMTLTSGGLVVLDSTYNHDVIVTVLERVCDSVQTRSILSRDPPVFPEESRDRD